MRPRIYPDPLPLRETILSENHIDALVAKAAAGGPPILLNPSMGAGKTISILGYLVSRRWASRCSGVLMFFNSHQQIGEIVRRLPDALPFSQYPPRDAQRCGRRAAEMTYWEKRGLPLIARIEVCRDCPARMGCTYFGRYSSSWARQSRLLIGPEQIVTANPSIIGKWTGIVQKSAKNLLPPLVIFDEAKLAEEGFYKRFIVAQVEQMAAAAMRAQLFAIVDLLEAVQRYPDQQPAWPVLDVTVKERLRLHRYGSELFGEEYRPCLDLLLQYVREPVWHEDGTYCTSAFPRLPLTTIFVGAFLDPGYLAERFRVPPPTPVCSGVVVLNPSTRVINVASSIGTRRYWKGRQREIINFAADCIAENVTAGKTTVVVGRKNGTTEKRCDEAMQLLRTALDRRGLNDVQVVPASQGLPELPSLLIVPFLTYGAVGLNSLEHYDTAVFVHGYYVPETALSELLFGHLPRSKRPQFQIRSEGGRRRIHWDDVVDPAVRRLARAALCRLECDIALQAFGRVRYTTRPRIVVMSVMHEVAPFVGTVDEVRNLTAARGLLVMDSTIDFRRAGRTDALLKEIAAGCTLKQAAERARIPYVSAKRLMAAHRRLGPPELRQDRPSDRQGSNPIQEIL